jgi:guanine deaminase
MRVIRRGRSLAAPPANRRAKNRPMPDTFMARAIELSIENVRLGGGPFAAVVVRKGKIIAEGANSVTSENDPTAHAEIMAIRAACQQLGTFELTGCEMFTSCEPCPMCLGAIYWARPVCVFFANAAADAAKFGFDDAFIYGEIQRAHGDRKIPMIQLMRKEALAAFRAWKQKPNKVQY